MFPGIWARVFLFNWQNFYWSFWQLRLTCRKNSSRLGTFPSKVYELFLYFWTLSENSHGHETILASKFFKSVFIVLRRTISWKTLFIEKKIEYPIIFRSWAEKIGTLPKNLQDCCQDLILRIQGTLLRNFMERK